MNSAFVMVLAVGVLGELSVLTLPCAAQTLSVSPSASTQTPQSQQAGPQPPLPSTGGAVAASSGVTVPLALAPSSTLPAPTRMAPGTVGRGLPGMPGGPPLNATMGAQDPSAGYMRPPLIGPLFCDPSLNIACQ
jgi:hypothetical protein